MLLKSVQSIIFNQVQQVLFVLLAWRLLLLHLFTDSSLADSRKCWWFHWHIPFLSLNVVLARGVSTGDMNSVYDNSNMKYLMYE